MGAPIADSAYQQLLLAIARIERKLDTLIEALGEDDEERPFDLDGAPNGSQRDDSQPL